MVLGASMAGLAHAAAAATRFDRVTLVDRDLLPDAADDDLAPGDPRRGVPQGSHLHLLLPAGVRGLEELLPGVTGDLVAHGAHVVGSPQWRFHLGGGRLRLEDPALTILGATRPLLEAVVRRHLLALPGVTLLDGWAARGLVADPDGRVTGAHLGRAAEPGETRTLAADLVVDATGRGSAAPRWLRELGRPDPETERIGVGVHYATRLFTRDPAALDGCRQVLVAVPPDGRRGGVALAVEGDRWLVTLVGLLGERPPLERAGFTDYAASLWCPDLHTVVAGSAPLGDPAAHAFPAYLRRRYDRMPGWPDGFVVAGDAVCSLNPVLAQGMTVAIAEALLLGEVLDRHGPREAGRRVLRRARPVVDDAWALATGTDLEHPEVDAPRPLSSRLLAPYLQRLLRVARHDPEVAAALIRVNGMVERPPSLLRPRTVARVVLGRRRAPADPPSSLDHQAQGRPQPERKTHVDR